jgi:hypothetical protein
MVLSWSPDGKGAQSSGQDLLAHPCCHASRLSKHGFIHSNSPAFRAGDQLFTDNGGLNCHSGRHEHHAAVHYLYAAGGALHQQAGGAEPAGSQGVPQVSSSWQ